MCRSIRTSHTCKSELQISGVNVRELEKQNSEISSNFDIILINKYLGV